MIPAAHEPRREACGHGHRTGAEHRVFQRDPRLVVEAAHLVVQRGLVAFEDEPRLEVILQVPADAGQIVAHLDPVVLQMRRVAQPGEHQEMRRADGSGRQDHFGSRAHHMLGTRAVAPDDPRGPLALEQDVAGLCPGQDRQVLALAHRIEKRDGGGTAPPVPRGKLEVAHAFLRGAVVIGVERVSGLLRRGDPGIADGPLKPHVGHRQGALFAVKRVGAALLFLGALEQRQDVVPTPARVAHLGPAVVILRLAAHVKKPVQRGRTAQDLSPRPVEPPSVQARVRLGPVAPVHRRVVHHLEIADRDMDPRVPVTTAGLQQDDLDRRVGRETIREHASGRARADDHVVC